MTQINEAKVILWAKDGCHYCQEIKTYFQENKVAYQVIDVTQQDNFRDILFAKYGVRYVPVVEIAQVIAMSIKELLNLVWNM